MKHLFNFFVVIIFGFLMTNNAFAACNTDGFTVVYVNGIFTPASTMADQDRDKLRDNFVYITSRRDVHFLTGYNPSHIAGVGDVVETASQILDDPISNYDRDTILLQIHPEVTTQKILLVGHSQGTFYTNEIYNYLVKNGESSDTVGVYNVATPASEVAGGGVYLTSENDKVINLVRTAASKVGAKQPLPANITIPPILEDSLGHSFSGVYLANVASPIVSSIDSGLKKLSVTETSNTVDAGCFTPPARDAVYYAQKLIFAVADPVATGTIEVNKIVVAVGKTALTQIAGAVSNFSQPVVSAIQQVLSSMFGGSNEKVVQTIDVNDNIGYASVAAPLLNDNTASKLISEQPAETPKIKNVTKTQVEEDKVIADEEQKKVVNLPEKNKKTEEKQAIVSKSCSFATSQSPSHSGLIINEVAWIGGSDSVGLTANDEWIELKNISGSNVDISRWQLIDKGEKIKINLGLINENKVKANRFILLERTDDDNVSNVPADLIYSGALSNTDEGLRLYDSQCNLVDEVMASPNWPAGDNAEKRTMERSPDLSWHTYNGVVQNNIFGTPKKENSTPVIVAINNGGGGSSSQNSQNNQNSVTGLVINEIMYDLPGSDSGREWIEIKNINSSAVDVAEVKLNENNTNHSLSLSNGGSSVPAGSFAVIANSAQKFMVDNASYSGILLEASFSLNNTGEPLAIKVGDTVLDQFSYSSSLGANGDGKSLQLLNASWLAATPTPGLENSASVSISNLEILPLTPLQITQVIYDPVGSDEGNELVEITNPNDEQVDISLYSLQYLGPSGDFTGIAKKNFQTDNIILGRGIFKIGANCHTDTPCNGVDMSWSQALGNESGIVFLVSNQESLTGISDFDIVDGFHYPEVTQLVAPSNFAVNYNPEILEINLSWDSNPSFVYQVQEYNSPGVTIFEGKGSSFTKRIDEVGKNYKFSITAFNENAEHTGLIEKEIIIPSFVRDVGFYNSLRYTLDGEQQGNLVEFSYNNYPFLPLDLVYASNSGPNYKTLVFYLNTEAPKRVYLNGSSPLAEDANNVLGMKYATCSFGNESVHQSILLPDTSEKCNLVDGFGNSSLKHPRYLSEGDKHLLLSTDGSIGGQSVFAGSDYITVAFYGFKTYFPQGYSPPGGIFENFKLLAVDKTKYYFQNTTPAHSSPTAPSNLEVLSYTVNSPTSAVQLSWDSSVDSDTMDSIIRYEWSLDDVLWKPISSTGTPPNKLSTTISLELGGTYNLSIRAVDDFGNLSDVLTKQIILPAPPPINLTPDPSNNYFAIDDIKLVGNVINIKWRLITNPASSGSFGIIPFDPLIWVPSNNLSNLQALHRNYDSNSSYPYITATSGACNAGITPFSQYILGWQYQTNFSSISGTPVTELLWKEINFGLYATAACDPSDNMIFSGYPIIVKN